MAANPGKRFLTAPAHPKLISQRQTDLRVSDYTQLDGLISWDSCELAAYEKIRR
jgi:hypothetical protein